MVKVIDFIVQFLAAALLLSGMWLTGNKRLIGPFLAFVAEVFTTIAGITHHTWSFVLIGIILFGIQGRNFVKWYREGAKW